MVYKEYIEQEKHLVAVDCAIFGYEENELKLLLFHRALPPSKGEWSLVGGWVNTDESVDNAAIRVLQKITGLHDIFMEQVQVFSKPNRDPGGRVITILFNALIDIEKHNKDLVREYGAHWWPVTKLPELIFDHNEMAKAAHNQLQAKASYGLIGLDLLPEEFTITQLRQLYNSIFLKEFDPGNFRKRGSRVDGPNTKMDL
ncbi:MAG: NUDIX hydrolase [Chloroflexia bacterium]|nr:NUDIX hydrolase [Chloroflexia bacterium]